LGKPILAADAVDSVVVWLRELPDLGTRIYCHAYAVLSAIL
jgi:hypothetical protein